MCDALLDDDGGGELFPEFLRLLVLKILFASCYTRTKKEKEKVCFMGVLGINRSVP